MKKQLTTKLACAMATILIGSQVSATILEEIVVTAQKREQNAQDIGIAITALTGEQMEVLNFSSAQQITAMSPGVSTVQPNGESNYSIAIRGAANSDFTTNVESPVAIYIDEVYVSQASGSGFALFDMERVEILRGPQGTLYGRNATGGLAHFVTKKPTSETDGYAKVTFGEYSQFKFEGAIGGAITERLSGRFSIATHNNDGYITNRLAPDDNLNNANDTAARLQLKYEFNDNADFLLSIRTGDQDIRTGFFENVSSVGDAGQLTPETLNSVLDYIDNDGNVYAGDYDDPGFNELKTRGYSGTLNWDLGNINLTSITDLSTVVRDYIEDSDASPVPFFNFFLTTDATQFSQEIRLDGSTESVKWVAGIYYLSLNVDDSNGAVTDPFIGPATTADAEAGLNNPYSNDLSSISAFGQFEYDLSDDLSLIVGARIINDQRDFDFTVETVEFLDPDLRDFDAPSNLNSLGVLANYSSSQDNTDITARVQFDWKVNDDTLLYASWNRGIRGGNFNAPIFPLTAPLDYNDETLSYDPEDLNALESGFKLSFNDGITRLNGSVYYYDYSDTYQAFNIIGLDTITTNEQADSFGFELELQTSPIEGLDVVLGVGYIDVTIDIDGNEVPAVQSPDWNVNGLARYQWPLFGGNMAIQGDFVYRSEHLFALTGLPSVTEDGYTIVNASLSYTSGNEHWTGAVFVTNLGDEEYQVQAFDLSTTEVFGITEQYYGRPQWLGVSVKYNF